MADFSVVGRERTRRVDAVGKATGEALYTDDIALARTHIGRILRSPHAHARILSIDATRARSLPGVKAVITAAEAPTIKVGTKVPDEEVLPARKVRFVGDHVAAVAAVDEDIAEEALSLIRVEYEPIPAVFDPEEALSPDAPRVHNSDTNVAHQFAYTRGSIDSAFADADLIFEETFRTHPVSTGAIEPFCCLASFEASGRMRFWTGAKNIFGVRQVVSQYLGIPESKVRVFQANVGGCFGGKSTAMRASFCCVAALLSQTIGEPVKLVHTREEELVAGRHRLPMVIRMKFGLKSDGTVIAKETNLVANAGAYIGTGMAIYSTAARRHESLYRFANIRTRAFLMYTNTVPGSAFRGFGNPQGHFAVESMMDIAAEKLGLDPVEIRLKNATQTGDITAHGWEIRSCGLTDCIKSTSRKAGWEQHNATRKPGVGLGIGCMIHASGRRQGADFYGSRAIVKIDRDGLATVFSGEGELGQGSHTVFAVIAAEELGIPLEQVEIAQPDTEISPLALGLFSDRGTILGGNAVRLAAKDAKRQLLQLAADQMEANVDDLIVSQGRVFVRGNPDAGKTVADVAAVALSRPDAEPVILGKASYDPPTLLPDPITLYGNLSTSYTFAAQVAAVQVDQETGKVNVTNVSAAHDLGRAINPMAASGQVEGAVVQGLGFALTEKLADPEIIPTSNPIDYRLPTSLDVPAMEATLIETDDPFGPFGAKGVGEPGLVAMAPAVANAIYDAVGVRIKDLPITPDVILRALGEKKLV